MWASEKYFLQGMCLFFTLAATQKQRNVLDLPQAANCVFNDVIRLDFVKFKSVMGEYKETLSAKQLAIDDENKDTLVKKTYEPEERV